MVNRSLMLSCLCETNPPFLHDNACFTSKGSPHVHRLGKPFKGRLYRKFTASRNSSLFRLNPCCSSGSAFNQELAPLSLACFTSGVSSGGIIESILPCEVLF